MAVKYSKVSSFGVSILSISAMGLSLLSSYSVKAQTSTDQPVLDPTPPEPALNSEPEPSLAPAPSSTLDATPSATTDQPERRQNRCQGKLPALNPYTSYLYITKYNCFPSNRLKT